MVGILLGTAFHSVLFSRFLVDQKLNPARYSVKVRQLHQSQLISKDPSRVICTSPSCTRVVYSVARTNQTTFPGFRRPCSFGGCRHEGASRVDIDCVKMTSFSSCIQVQQRLSVCCSLWNSSQLAFSTNASTVHVGVAKQSIAFKIHRHRLPAREKSSIKHFWKLVD